MTTFTNDFYKLVIEQDENAASPRIDMDNLGVMVCFHGRYSLGDKHEYEQGEYNGWNELKKAIIRNENVAVILPLYLYDHSGITISTTPFSCPWDSGQIGFIYMTKKDAIENYGKKIVTKKEREKAEAYLNGEVETYDQYLTGDIYGFKLYELKEDGNYYEIDSCWGFYGSNPLTNGMSDFIPDDMLESLKTEFA